MKPIPAIVESVFAAAEESVRVHFSAYREAEHQLEKASGVREERAGQLEKAEKRVEHWTKEKDRERLETGRALAAMRPRWPTCGPNAKGWGVFLKSEGIDERSARDWMDLAGYVEDVSEPKEFGSENIPTRREVSAAKAEARRTEPTNDNARFDPNVDTAPSVDIRLGDYRSALAGIGVVDAVIVDPPYSERTHAAATTRADGTDAAGLTPSYGGWSFEDVHEFVKFWSARCRGWIVALTDSELIPAWRDAYRECDRYAFAPVPCVITGMSVRISGDGPSSWAVYAMVSRPAALIKWGTLPGAYVGGTERGAGGGRGKPSWLMDSIVRDYTRRGDLVVDPMSGFGSTIFSAMRQGCRAIGSEIDPAARTEALARAKEELQQPSKAPRD